MLSPKISLQKKNVKKTGLRAAASRRRSLDARRRACRRLFAQHKQRKLNVRPEAMKLAGLVDVHNAVRRLSAALPNRVGGEHSADSTQNFFENV